MNSPVIELGGFDKVVFESVIDTLAGGAGLALGAYTNANGVIPAGLPVGFKDVTTGLHPIITEATALLSARVLGYVHADVKIVAGQNHWVGVVIEGAIRLAAMPTGYTAAGLKSANGNTKVTLIEV